MTADTHGRRGKRGPAGAPPKRRRWRHSVAAAAVGALPAALVVSQVQRLRSIAYLPVPTYEIDATVGDGAGPALRLAVVGDSLVAGVGAPWPQQSLPWQLAQRVSDLTGRRVHVVGLGRPSATTAQVLEHQVPLLPGDAEVVVVVAGANDILRRTNPAAFTRSFRALLAGAQVGTGARVVVAGMPDFRSVTVFTPPVRSSLAVWAQHLHARQRRVSADLGAVFVDTKGQVARTFRRDARLLGGDGVHPSPEGYARLAAVLAPAVAGATGPPP